MGRVNSAVQAAICPCGVRGRAGHGALMAVGWLVNYWGGGGQRSIADNRRVLPR